MGTLTVTAKGQVTLRKEVLKHLGVKPGETVSVENGPKGQVILKASKEKADIRRLFGMLKGKTDKKLSIDEINEAIAQGWAGKR